MDIKLLFTIALVFLLLGCSQSHDIMEAKDDDYLIIKIKDIEIRAEVAKSRDKREKGLMYRKDLPKGTGMFFIYNSARKGGFWMKNMQFPLDILFINKEYEIVDIKRGFAPCLKEPCIGYRPKASYQYVLEINSGSMDRHRISDVNKITIE